MKLLVDGFSTKITRVRQELHALVYPSSIDLSSRTLRFLAGQLSARQREIGTRWRRLPAGRQALLALAHFRCGDTYARLAAGFGIGIATFPKLSTPFEQGRPHSAAYARPSRCWPLAPRR
jgi:hypothetical protein